MPRYHRIQGKDVPFTAEEEAQWDARETEWNDNAVNRKLDSIKEIRLQKLQETDYMGFDDVTMPENIKTWRQSLRDIPQTYTTEEEYDLLVTQDEQGNLTHEIWSKP